MSSERLVSAFDGDIDAITTDLHLGRVLVLGGSNVQSFKDERNQTSRRQDAKLGCLLRALIIGFGPKDLPALRNRGNQGPKGLFLA